MRLSRLTVVNYARIPDLDLSMGQHVVLVGPNDVGKTCILRCIHFALGATIASLYQSILPSDIADPAKALRIAVDLVDFNQNEKALFPDEITVDPDGSQRLRICVEAEGLPGDGADLAIRRYFPESGHLRAPTRQQLAGVGWHYLPAVRSGGAEGVEGRASGLRSLLQTVDLGDERKKLGETLEELNSDLNESKTLMDLRVKMAEHLSLATARQVTKDDLVFRSAATPDEMVRILNLLLNRADGLRPLSEQSDGMNALAAMAFYDLSSTASNIVAIDEPETHLHPAAQRALADLLASGKNQKVISTHSPFIVQRFDPEWIVAFTASRECRQLQPGLLSKTDKVMAQWWTGSKLEPLTASRIVFVEGLADRIILEACARAANISLDRRSISIVELGGATAFGQANRFFGRGGFGADVAGLVDADAEHIWAKDLLVDIADLSQHAIYVSRDDLEAEYVRALGAQDTVAILVSSGAFTRQQILNFRSVPAMADLKDLDVIDFCRKNKVQAALAVSTSISESHVKQMQGMNDLLEDIKAF